MPILVFLLFLLALFLFWQAARRQRSSGLPGGRIIYTDTHAWGKVEKPLYDAETGLTGKPDYLVEQRGRLVPVEVKTSRIPEAPYDSHIFQLCGRLLVQPTAKTASGGIIHYSDEQNAAFAVDYTDWKAC
jgi:CRISPR-associated exonuclease Cas4